MSFDEGKTKRRGSVGSYVPKKNYTIATEKCGDLSVHVQGDLSQQEKRAVFLTVHDLGSNHHSFENFVNLPCMNEIKDRSVFIHVDVPGHEDNAEVLPDTYQFPSLQVLGEDLVSILDTLQVRYVIGFGEGAGANVIARFGLAHPSRTVGLILINCTGSSMSVKENFKAKFISWKGKSALGQSAMDYLVFHKFGHQMVNDTSSDKEQVIAEFVKRLQNNLNNKNLRYYVNAFLNRKDLLLKEYKQDILLVTGVLGSYANVVEKLHRELDKNKATLIKIERAGDVLGEAPAKMAQSILLFCKGQGLLTSVTLPGIERQRTYSAGSADSDKPRRLSRGMSMEDYDRPNIRRLSLSIHETIPQSVAK